MSNLLKLIISLALPLGVGAISGIATSNNVDTWFTTINKPAFNPPSWVFAPVWTTLYILMGVAFFLVWKSSAPPSANKRTAASFFMLQMALNFLWSFLFFHFHEIGLALLDIILLWCSIILCIIYFRKINKTAALLLLPYLLWVSFATVLNAAIYMLN